MTNKTTHQVRTDDFISAQDFTNPLTVWFASVWGFVTHIGPVGRGVTMLIVLLLVATPSFGMLFPRSVTPATTSLDVFSAERAMAHLPIIAKEPHPQGSPAQARVRDYLIGQLKDMGIEVQVQRTQNLENVVARLRGTDPTGAIVVLAHYDTVSYSNGAADNSSTVAALLEIMRSLSAGPAPLNDVIALFDDGEEEPDIFAGTKAFVHEHPWMKDVRVAISIDTAVAGAISTNEVGPRENGWLVHALANAYTGGLWTSFSGGGQYNSTPFRNAGIPVLALEDNYPFKEKHTTQDLPEIIRAGSVQQMGEQTLAIVRELGRLDLNDPRGEQETFFSLPLLGLAHYPEAWSFPLAMTAGIFLLLTLGLALWRKFASWRGLLVALGTILATVAVCGIGVNAIKPLLPGIFSWKTYSWPDWPEVIPPYGGFAAAMLGLIVLAVTTAGYLLARRWSTRSAFSLIGLLFFLVPAVILALNIPRTAYAFLWPVLIGSSSWSGAAISKKEPGWSQDIAATLAALPVVVLLLPFLPGVVMADGMKSLEILAAMEALLLSVILPAVDGLLVQQPAGK